MSKLEPVNYTPIAKMMNSSKSIAQMLSLFKYYHNNNNKAFKSQTS